MTRSRIGPLALESPLGARGSNVFRAVHMQQKTQVAVRVFSMPMGMTPEAKQEFADQLEGLKALRHASIVRCYGGGFDAKDAYLVHELFLGESLDVALERRERLPWESVLDMGLQLCEALQFAHDSGWIHGRIRPDKVLMSQDGSKFKLNDFRRGPGSPAMLTAEQLAYSAPETFAERPKTEVASDLYSVGAVLYHAITGTPPFQAGNPSMMKQAIRENVVTPVATIVFDCPVWLSSIVEHLMNKDPLRRPYSATATAMALREAQKRASEGISVAEHTLSGFSALQLNTTREEAEKALGQKKKKKKRKLFDEEEPDTPGILERPLILVTLLALTIGLITYLVWPPGEKTLRARAERLISAGDLGSLNDARDKYLHDLLERFPNGPHAGWAQEQLDLIEMENAEESIQRKRRFGREPSSEGERKFMEANRYELFGDRVTALEQYRGIVNLLKDEDKERAYVNLARRQIAKIQSNPPNAEELRRFLKSKLDEADKIYANGDAIGSKQIWEGIVNLYNGNKEMLPIVEQAQARISKLKN
ncbi:MAG: serine/threonine-protein kinase [Pirellula sp.]